MDEDRPTNPRPGPFVERFRSSVEEDDDVVRVYEELLLDLTFNSKPIITELTIIAGEQREHAEEIADAICERILEVPVDQKLPSLYLLDSIVKNIGHEYVKHFAARLPKVFCAAFNQVHPNMHPSMRHLFRTWSQVFPSSVLHKIEEELQFSNTESQRSAGLVNVRNSESPSPRPSHGIHVNPKYLEAQRQIQHSSAIEAIGSQRTVHTADFEEDGMERLSTESPKGWSGATPKFHDIEDSSGNSSRMHVNGHNPSIQYGEYDFSYREGVLPHLGRPKVASGSDVEGSIRHFNVKVAKPLSPSKLMLRRSSSPVDERFTGGGSPWRATDRASASYPRPGFGPGKLVNHNGWLECSFPSDMGHLPQPGASSAYDPSIGQSKKHSRELINAYGSYKEHSTSFEKHPKLQRIEVNGVNREATARNWRSFEEEEYDWEDMSPTLASRSGRNSLPSLGPNSGVLRRVSLGRPDVGILEPDIRSNNWFGQTKLHPFDDPARIVDDRIPIPGSAHASMHTRSSYGRGGPNELFGHNHISQHVQEPGKFPYSFQHPSRELGSMSQGWGPHLPSRVSGTAAGNGPNLPGLSDNSPDVELPFQRLAHIRSDSSNVETSVLEKQLALRPFSPPAAPVMWPPVHNSQPLPLHPIPQNLNHPKGVNLIESSKPVYQGPIRPRFLPHQQFESADRETPIPNKLLPLPQQQPGFMHTNHQINEQDAHGGNIPSVSGQLSSHMWAQPHRMQMHGQGASMVSLPNSLSGMTSLVAGGHDLSNASSLVHGGIVPPLPLGPPPGPSHMGPVPQNTGPIVSGPPVSAFSGLITNLMAQGLISLTTPTRSEDSLGLDFNSELLKVRHESAINALYTNLSRQCTTCGLRFKFQEEHSSHMDWHVTKNRISKNRKQKPSRKWFVNTKEWLSGAETVGTDVVPFLPTDVVLEKKEDKEMAVPADEDQTVCALCGEPFEDFYSDEAEEWMYKGAVYMNAPNGYTDGLDRSHLGPIVHAKCRSDSNDGS